MIFYNVILNLLALPIILIIFFVSLFNVRLRKTLFARLGFQKINRLNKQPLWFHCSSLGEFNAIKNLIIELRKHYKQIFITTLTDTGFHAAEKLMGKGNVAILPLDFNFLIRFFIKRLNPKLLIIEETEMWPNLIFQTGKAVITIIYNNCIINQKSYIFYNKLSFIFKNILQYIHVFFVQNEMTKKFLLNLHVNRDRIRFVGNIKFDIQLPENKRINNLKRKLYLSNSIVITAGSTREGEEEILLGVFEELKKNYPHLRLIIVPRHLNRINEIEKLIEQKNLRYTLYTKFKKEFNVLLVDRMGILTEMYQLSDIAFIGGTLVPVGGHNPIEAAYFKKPIISGPYIKNNQEAFIKIHQNKGGYIVQNKDELLEELKILLNNRNKLKEIGKRAFKVIKDNQGASKRIVHYIVKQYL